MENQIDQIINQDSSIKKLRIVDCLFFAIAIMALGFFIGTDIIWGEYFFLHAVSKDIIVLKIAPAFFGLILALWFGYRNNITIKFWKKIVLMIISWIAFFAAQIATFLIVVRYLSFDSGESESTFLGGFIVGSILGTLILSFGVHFLIKKLSVENFILMLVLGALAGLIFNFLWISSADDITALAFIVWQLIIAFGFEFIVNGFFNKSEKIKL